MFLPEFCAKQICLQEPKLIIRGHEVRIMNPVAVLILPETG